MRQTRTDTAGHCEADGFADLDRIVAQVFQSFEGAGDLEDVEPAQPRRGRTWQSKPSRRPRPTPDAMTELPASTTADAPLRPLHPKTPDVEGAVPDPGADDGLPDRQPAWNAASDLFSAEEEEFVVPTVAWLVARPNADILLERIWAEVLERQEADRESDRTPDPGGDEGPDAPTRGARKVG